MGLLSLPCRGLLRVFEEIAESAERELYSDEAIMAELTGLYARLESGALPEEAFGRREAELVERLEEIEARRRTSRA